MGDYLLTLEQIGRMILIAIPAGINILLAFALVHLGCKYYICMQERLLGRLIGTYISLVLAIAGTEKEEEEEEEDFCDTEHTRV